MDDKQLKEAGLAGLGGLINRIKAEGIDEAARKSDEIISKAKADAALIVAEAKSEAEGIVLRAETGLKDSQEKGRVALGLAVRDAVIRVRRAAEDMLALIAKRECKKALSGDGLERAIFKFIDDYSRDSSASFEVLLNEKDRQALSGSFLKKLKDELKCGVEIVTHSGIKGGFRIGRVDDAMHYDLSDEAISELLISYLTPELAAVLSQGKGKDSEQ
jgi:V/A-type H+-transporting ATPase subunit E